MTDPAGFKTFADDVVLTASEINGYLMQGILVFADSAARDTALSGSLAEGRFCYLKSNNTTYYYSGSGWVAVGSAAATISGTTGSPSTGTGKDGKALYTWTGAGSFTVSVAGLVRIVAVDGGSGANATPVSGCGGQVTDLILWLEPGTYTVTIGAAGAWQGGNGGQTKVTAAGLLELWQKAANPSDKGDGGRSADLAGVYTDISGSSVGYGGGGQRTGPTGYNSAFGGEPSGGLPRANSGGGGSPVGAATGAGAAGIVQLLV